MNYQEQSYNDCLNRQAELEAQGIKTTVMQDHDGTYYLVRDGK